MRIAFTGAQSTGKTTLINALHRLDEFSSFTLFDNIVRKATQGIVTPDLTQGGDPVQDAILQALLTNLQTPDFLADRCLIDCYVYGMYQYLKGHLSEGSRHRLTEALPKVVAYDYIFFLEPEFGVVPDGVRNSDPIFQEVIGYLFTGVIEDLKKKYQLTNIYKITGSVEERVSQIRNIMKVNGDL